MKFFNTFVLTIFLSLSFFQPTQAQQPPQMDGGKRQLIMQVLQTTGGLESIRPAIQRWLAKYQQAYPQMPQGTWHQIEQQISAEMQEMSIQTWDHYYTEQDLRALLSFYTSPAGQKLLKTRTPLTQDIMRGGEQIGSRMDAMVQQMVNGRSSGPSAPGRR